MGFNYGPAPLRDLTVNSNEIERGHDVKVRETVEAEKA